jgi:spermidine/putrescine transport system permease protein
MVAPGKQATLSRAERLPGVPAIRIGNTVLSIYSLLFYLFIYGPILILIVYSFNASRFPTRWAGFSLEWYQKLFQNRAMGQALRNSLIISFSSTAISTVIGTMVSVAIERYRFKGKTPLDAMLFLPIIIPDIAMAIMLVAFFGLINMPLGFGTIIISHVAFNISFVAIVVRSRMTTIDPTLEEAANDLYANEWQAFWRITFPLLLPGILGGALLAFTLSLDDYVITFFTSGPGSTTLPLRIYGMVKTGITPEVNAISTLMMAASLALVILSLWIQGKGEAMG